jgi:hypothetical protein
MKTRGIVGKSVIISNVKLPANVAHSFKELKTINEKEELGLSQATRAEE